MSRPPQASEREATRAAILAVRGGDLEAFARVVEIYQRRVLGLVLMMTQDRTAAEDVMQESFIRAYTNLERYDPRRDFYPWLATIAVRLAQNWLKRHGRIVDREGVRILAGHDASGATDALQELMEDERARRLWAQVAALPQGERITVLLYYREEMKVRDIAETLGVTDGTVKTLLFRARQKLRRMMTEAEPRPADEQEEAL